MHGQDNAFWATGRQPTIPVLPAGRAGPSWNGGFVEAHYAYSPQLIFYRALRLVHMSRQADPTFPQPGNVELVHATNIAGTIMLSRAGSRFTTEYAQAKWGTCQPAARTRSNRSVMVGFDFDY